MKTSREKYAKNMNKQWPLNIFQTFILPQVKREWKRTGFFEALAQTGT